MIARFDVPRGASVAPVNNDTRLITAKDLGPADPLPTHGGLVVKRVPRANTNIADW